LLQGGGGERRGWVALARLCFHIRNAKISLLHCRFRSFSAAFIFQSELVSFHTPNFRQARHKLITARRGDIWITTAGAIYDHVLTLPKGSIPGE
jgi:hypothetical protein